MYNSFVKKNQYFLYADVAQLVEQLIRNEQVAGSSPVIGSKSPAEEVVKKRLNRDAAEN